MPNSKLNPGDTAVYREKLKCHVMRVNYSKGFHPVPRSALVDFGAGVPLWTIPLAELEPLSVYIGDSE